MWNHLSHYYKQKAELERRKKLLYNLINELPITKYQKRRLRLLAHKFNDAGVGFFEAWYILSNEDKDKVED